MSFGEDDKVVGQVPISYGGSTDDDWGQNDKVVKQLWEPGSLNRPAPAKVKPPETPIPTLVEAGWEGLKGDVRTGAARVASGLGWNETSKYIQEQARKNYEEQARRPLTDLDESLWKGIYEQATASLPSMAPVMAGGLAGGAAGTAVAGPVGTVVGSILGGTAAALPQFVGSNLKRQVEEQKVPLEQTDLATAGGTAVLQASLDSLLGGGLFGGAFKVPAAIAKRTVARAATKALQGVATEGLTEGAQQWLEVLQANPEKARSMPKEVWKEVLDAMIVGGAMGGVAGGIAGIPKPKEQASPSTGDEPPAPPPAAPPEPPDNTGFQYPPGGGQYQPVFGDHWFHDEPPPPPLNPPAWSEDFPAPGDDPSAPRPLGPPAVEVGPQYGPEDYEAPTPGDPPPGWDASVRPPTPGVPPGERFTPEEVERNMYPQDTSQMVFDRVKQMLVAAGRPVVQANAMAKLWKDRYAALAKDTGWDANTLFERENLEIIGAANRPAANFRDSVNRLVEQGLSFREAVNQTASKQKMNFKGVEDRSRTLFQGGEESDTPSKLAQHYPLLLSAIRRAPWQKATGQQWKNYLQKQGVKAEEMEWSDIGDWLEENKNEKLGLNDILGEHRDMTPDVEMLKGDAAPYANMTLGGMGSDPKHNYRVMLLSLPQLGEFYAGGHWSRDVMNVVAHTRLTDTTTADGKTVTIGNEFQSDPHQTAREKGYRLSAAEGRKIRAKEMDHAEELSNMVLDAEDARNAPFSREDRNWLNSLADPNNNDTGTEFLEIVRSGVVKRFGEDIAKMADEQRKLAVLSNRATKGVTNMPFKETWPNLLFRQGLMDAINNGKDYFAWPTGEQETVIQGHQGSEKHEKAHKLFMDKRLVDYATKLGKAYGVKPEKITVTQGGESSFIFDKNGRTITVRDPQSRNFLGEYNLRDDEDYRDFVDTYGYEALNFVRSQEDGNHFYEPGKLVDGMDLQGWEAEAENAARLNQQMLDEYGIGYDTLLADIDNILEGRGIPKAQWNAIKRNLDLISNLHVTAEMAIDQLKRAAKLNLKEHQVWALPITPQMRELIQTGGLPLYQQGKKPDSIGRQNNNTPKGNIDLLRDRTIIRLFDTADASTFLHESAHLFLEQMIRYAPHSSKIAQDLVDVRKWLGNNGGPFTRKQHETFARGFEKYLMTGKAPNKSLLDLFAQFAEWLKKIYRSADALKVDVPKHIEEIYGRLLASDDKYRNFKKDQPIELQPGERRMQNLGSQNVLPQKLSTTEMRQSFEKDFKDRFGNKLVLTPQKTSYGDSQYLKVMYPRRDPATNQTRMVDTGITVRFASHAQSYKLDGNTISIDDATNNTNQQVMDVIHHYLTGEGQPPRIGVSFLDYKNQKQYRAQATYDRIAAKAGRNPFKYDQKTIREIPFNDPLNQNPMGDEDPKIKSITDRMNALIRDFHDRHPQFRDLRVGGSREEDKLYAWRTSPMGKEYAELQADRYELVRASGMTLPQYNAKYGKPFNIRTVMPDVAADRQMRKGQSRWITNADGSITKRDSTDMDDDSSGSSLNQTPMGDEASEENNPRNPRIAQNPIQRGLSWLQRAFNPFSQLEDADSYRDMRNLASGGVYAATQAAAKAKKALAGLNPADRELVNNYMETPNADPTTLPTGVREEVVNLKKYINGPLKRALVDNKLLSEAASKSYDDAYLPRLYFKYLLEGEGNVKGARMNRHYSKQRSNKTEDELLAMGEIRDPSIRVFYGLFRPMRDLAMMNFLQKIASTTGKNWIIPKSVVEWDGQKVTPHWLKSEAEAIRTIRSKAETDPDRVKAMLDVAQRMEDTATEALNELGQADYNPSEYAEIPNTRQFGPMRGMVVRKEIADDITGAVNFVQPNNWFDKWFGDRQSYATKAISLWKFAKVPLNPPSQMRNVISNMVLLNLSGVRIDRVVPLMVAAAKDMKADGKYFQIAKKYGVGVGTFSEQELYAITDELNKIEMNNLGSGFAGWRAIYKALLKGGKKVGDVYQMMEVWGKVAKIKHAMENETVVQDGARRKMNEAEAVREANKWLFDYSEVPQGVRRARQSPIGYPFMTFTYKVIPLMAEVVRRHPTRMLPYVAMGYLAPAMVAAMNDIDQDDPEKLRKSLPQALRKYNDMYLLPFKDSDGRWQFANIGYFFPWQMPYDGLRNLGAAGMASLSGDQREALKQLQEAGASTNILSNPLFNMVTAITTGIDPFSGKPIADKRDTPRMQVMDILSYVGGLVMPTMFSPFGALGMALKDQTSTGLNRYGEPGMTPGQIAARAVGINVYPVIPEAQRARNIQQMQREIQDIRTRMTFSLRDQSLTPEQRRRMAEDFTDTIKDRVAQLQKYMKESQPSPRLRAASTVN